MYFTNTRSVASYYSELSDGKMSIGGDVFGYFTLAVSTTSCDYGVWATAARAAASATGIDLSSYTNVAYAFPKQSSCWWSGLANLPGRNTWINGSMSLYVASHELGHNFGAHHAATVSCSSGHVRVAYSANCSTSEYGDPYDVMGYQGQRHMQAWHRWQVGFLGSADVQTVTTHGRYHVATAELAGGSPRILRVVRPSGDYYYLEFRQPFGRYDNFAATAPPVTGVAIRIAPDFARVPSKLIDTTPETSTYADAPLAVGRTFVDPINQIYITTVSIGPSGAEVLVQAGPDVVAPTSPTNLQATTTADGSITLNWSAATDDVMVMGYSISRDGVALGTVSDTTFTDPGLPQAATYLYQVAALDRFNSSLPVTVAVYLPDTTFPQAPSSVTATDLGARAVEVAWTPATDNVGVVGYQIMRDGLDVATTGATTFVDNPVPDGQEAAYEVRAVDAAGNLGAPASAAVTPADITPPQLGDGLRFLIGTPASVTLTWTLGTDNVGVAGYRVSRDGETLAVVTEPGYVDSTVVEATTYEYAVAALDAAGLESVALAATVFVPDTTAPSAPTGLSAVLTTPDLADLAWDAASDNVGVDHYVITRGGTVVAETSDLGTASVPVEQAHAYRFAVWAVDGAGNAGDAVVVDLTVPDVTPPGMVTITSATRTSETSTAITWDAASDNVGVTRYVVSRDGAVVASVSATIQRFADSLLPSDLTYAYSVAAVDAAGNVGSPAPASVTLVSIDRISPTAPNGLQAQALGSRRVSLTWNPSTDDRAGTIRYAVFRNRRRVALIATTSYVDRPAYVGTYRYRVRAIDAAGNVSPFSATVSGAAKRHV